MDLQGRGPVDVQAHSDYTNLVGNVLGFQGQSLLSYNQNGYSYTQNAWSYEMLEGFPKDGEVTIWSWPCGNAGALETYLSP